MAYTQCMECCFNRQIMRIFYFAFCVMLVLYELLLVYIIVLIEQWDVFKGDVDSYEIGTLTQTVRGGVARRSVDWTGLVVVRVLPPMWCESGVSFLRARRARARPARHGDPHHMRWDQRATRLRSFAGLTTMCGGACARACVSLVAR